MYKINNKSFDNYNDALIYSIKIKEEYYKDLKTLVNDFYPNKNQKQKEKLLNLLFINKEFKIIHN